MGALSLAFSWIPFINILGIILGFVGIILGLVGIFFSNRIRSVVGLALSLAGVILGFVVTSSAVSAIDQAVNAPPQTGSQTTQERGGASPAFPGATTKDRVAQAGETVVEDGLSLTSSAVETGDSTYGKSLCTEVHYSNGTAATVSFNAFDWKMQDPNGTILSTTFGGSQKMLNSGELAPGGKVSGDVCFDNKSGTPGQHIVLHQGSIFSGDRIAWLTKAG